MARLQVEFTVEPFTEGRPGPHVRAAVAALDAAGLAPDVGPFGTEAEGEQGEVVGAVAALLHAAFDHGASNVALAVRRAPQPEGHGAAFLAALKPVARALGARIVGPDAVRPHDVPLRWEGELVGAFQLPEAPGELQGALDRLIVQVERDLGGRLATLGREQKQAAVRLLDEHGAFALRGAIEEVADAMGVSRVTVYNYLNAIRRA